ncbi:MAG: NAD(P)H-binding protein [Armatimonadetes bacterium]|nr:NAD(P)H-binding protein [Armatimonadota bacterium]
MLVLVTGAAGFVGSHLIKRLVSDGREVRALVRRGPPQWMIDLGVKSASGDVTDAEDLARACDGADAIVHCVGIINEARGIRFETVIAQGTKNMVRAGKLAGVRKFVYVSALGTHANARSRYHRAKWQAEEAVRNGGVAYTIVRPSVIFGPEDRFINLFAGGFTPFPGGGRNLLQPVYVEDVAAILSSCLGLPASDNQTFGLGGPERLSLREVIGTAERVMGVRGAHPPVPVGLVMLVARFVFDPLQKAGVRVPVTSDQLLMLREPNVCTRDEDERVRSVFGLPLTPYEEGLRSYVPANAARRSGDGDRPRRV